MPLTRDCFATQRLLSGTRYQPLVAQTVAAAKRALERVQPAAILLDVVLFGDESIPRIYRGAEAVEAADEDWVVDPSRTQVLVVDDNLADIASDA